MKKKNNIDLKSAIESVAINKDIKANVILDTLLTSIKGQCAEYLDITEEEIIVKSDNGDKIEIFLIKKVVEKIKRDNLLEITPDELAPFKIKAKIGNLVEVPFFIEDLSRKNIKQLNFTILGKLKNIRKEILFQEYCEKEGGIVTGSFLRKIDRNIIISLPNSAEGMLHFKEQIYGEQFSQGDLIKCYVKSVDYNAKNYLSIELSRQDVRFVVKLFANEVKEIQDGIIKVEKIVREAGKKTKIAVYSTKSEVEPVGACIGLYGNRIKAVMKELNNERIDIVPYSKNIKEFITKALEPGKVIKILLINELEKEALVIVEDASYPLAIGRHGLNVKLASALVGWEISVRTRLQMEKHPEIIKIFSKIDQLFDNNEQDINQLSEIDEELLVKLMNSGVNTVAELYEMDVGEISRIEGITQEDAEKVKKVLENVVEVVKEDEEGDLEETYEVEDRISGVDIEDNLKEEIQQVEYLVCPSCNFEFEYTGQEKCPKCGAEFELE